MPVPVNVDNFVHAETDRMFADLQGDAGGVNVFRHNREPASIDGQTVIRMNRDTLYSFAIVDLARPAVLTLPETGGRYVSAMVVNQHHLVNAVHHDAGDHILTSAEFESPYVLVAVRTLVDPDDPDDVAAVAALQDRIGLRTASEEPFVSPDHDTASLDTTRNALLTLAGGMTGFDRMFGRREEVDPVRHLLGTAAGWGGLPTSEASYVGVAPGVPPGDYELTLKDVPVDAFWSVSVYNAAGFFEPNPRGRYSVNSVTGVPNQDGSHTIHFTADPDDERPQQHCHPAGVELPGPASTDRDRRTSTAPGRCPTSRRSAGSRQTGGAGVTTPCSASRASISSRLIPSRYMIASR